MNKQCKICSKQSDYLNSIEVKDDYGGHYVNKICDSCWDSIAQIAENMIQAKTNARFAELDKRLAAIESQT
jgi:hypothetical protein